ncbi:MAG: hypothetical protein AAFY34_14745 [Pseudomonadota bacterium]
MYSKTRVLSCLLALFVAASADAQIESSGLDDVSPWTVGFLEADQQGFPPNLWTTSDPDRLLDLLGTIETQNLSPGEHALLRQILYSPGNPPEGDKVNDLMAERARLLLELGEADAAVTLLPLVQTYVGELDPEETAIDLLLGLGNHESACAASESEAREGAFWAKLRATCFALDENSQGAELALELAISEGVDDPWFYEAVFAAVGLAPDPPSARYDSGIALTLSKKAGLPVPTDAIAGSRLDLTAAIAQSTELQPELRVLAAGLAAEKGLIGADEHRATYEALLAQEAFTPRSELDGAITANWVGEASTETKSRLLNAALETAEGHISRYHAVSRLLLEDINALDKDNASLRYGLAFARANLAAGDVATAGQWANAVSENSESNDNAFEVAWSLGLMRLADADAEVASANELIARLIDSTDSPAKQAALQRLLVLWSAFDLELGSEGRLIVASEPADAGAPISPWLLRGLRAAAKDGASAELSLQVLAITSGDPSTIQAADLAQIIEALRLAGAEDAARQLALESTGFWKREL